MSEHHWLYSTSPNHDFKRQHLSKLNFEDTVRLILTMQKGTVSDELINYFDMDEEAIPSQSTFNRRRGQITPFAFRYLFDEFASSFPQITHKTKGYCVLAADGTHVVYSTNEEIIEDYNKPHMADHKGYNHMQMNAFLDVHSYAFHDIVIQPGQHPDGREALSLMIDHFDPDEPEKYIITADRGYESYDLLFHCELKKFKYVIRMRSPEARKTILSAYKDELPMDQDEFDVTIRRFFTDKYTNEMKSRPEIYHYVNPSKGMTHFYEALGEKNLLYMCFRVVKLKSKDGAYEYILTNLPNSLDKEDIRSIYKSRLNIELSFRWLKHAAGLLYFHSRKPEYIEQEIYACMVMYNFGVFLASLAVNEYKKKHPKKKDQKYEYTVDFSTAIRTTRKYFLRDTTEKPVDIIKLLSRFVHAVKERFREFKRPLRGIGAVHFNYR